LIAFGRSDGKMCLGEWRLISGDDEVGLCDKEERSRDDAGENKSGVDDRVAISQS
jgi:hypothetical protein